jgi:proteasome lid subunit RPN8/RPN11
MRRLVLASDQLEAMRLHLDACLPLEGCGLLAGRADTVERVLPVANQAQSEVRFRMDPREQVRAFDWMETNRLELTGIFHSHPSGPDRPSASDIAEAAYPVVYVIWSRRDADWTVKGYWIEGNHVTEVRLDIAGGS